MARRKRIGMHVITQKNNVDCGLAALAMLLGVPYGDVSAACLSRYGARTPNNTGLALYHLEELADCFGVPLRRIYISKNYLDGQTGVLGLNRGPIGSDGHWVVLQGGNTVLDPADGTVWNLDDFITKFHYRPATLLVPVNT